MPLINNCINIYALCAKMFLKFKKREAVGCAHIRWIVNLLYVLFIAVCDKSFWDSGIVKGY